MALRLVIGGLGLAGIVYGSIGILGRPESSHPVTLAVWLAVAVALHDGLLVPAVLLVGALLTRVVPPRARGYVQGALVAGGLVTAYTLPLVYRQGTQPRVEALVVQDYATNLLLVLAVIAVGAAGAYLVRLVRDRRAQAVPGHPS